MLGEAVIEEWLEGTLTDEKRRSHEELFLSVKVTHRLDFWGCRPEDVTRWDDLKLDALKPIFIDLIKDGLLENMTPDSRRIVLRLSVQLVKQGVLSPHLMFKMIMHQFGLCVD